MESLLINQLVGEQIVGTALDIEINVDKIVPSLKSAETLIPPKLSLDNVNPEYLQFQLEIDRLNAEREQAKLREQPELARINAQMRLGEAKTG